MTEEEMNAFQQAWKDFPSQDNEGYQPDRGGFKCGWFAALGWVRGKSNPDASHRLAVLLQQLLNKVNVVTCWERHQPEEPTCKGALAELIDRQIYVEQEFKKVMEELKK